MIGTYPPSGRTILDGICLVERRFKTEKPRHAKIQTRAKLRTVGTTISGAKGSEATTTQGATVPSSGPKGAGALVHARGRDQGVRGLLRVTLAPTLATHLLMRDFAEFARLHPDIEMEILSSGG